MTGCDKYEPWAALLVGAWGGMGFIAMHHLMIKMKLDDPLGKNLVTQLFFSRNSYLKMTR